MMQLEDIAKLLEEKGYPAKLKTFPAGFMWDL